jgi:hypothetical protein
MHDRMTIRAIVAAIDEALPLNFALQCLHFAMDMPLDEGQQSSFKPPS